MNYAVRVPWEKSLGNIGEAEIQKRLSYFALTTKIKDDVGIDFYCELLEHSEPTNEFYVQAKCTQHFDENGGQSIKKTTINYWLLKPNPVYLIVFDEPNNLCYWMAIEDHRYELIEKMSQTNSETIYLKLDRSDTLENGKWENMDFIAKIKEDKQSIELFRGRPSFKGIAEAYVKQVPDAPRNQNELLKVRENIRQYLYSLVRYYMQADQQTAVLYCEFLAKFDPTGHYNHFFWLGILKLEAGDKGSAKKAFEQALWICDQDKIWPSDSMAIVKEKIQELLLSCKQ